MSAGSELGLSDAAHLARIRTLTGMDEALLEEREPGELAFYEKPTPARILVRRVIQNVETEAEAVGRVVATGMFDQYFDPQGEATRYVRDTAYFGGVLFRRPGEPPAVQLRPHGVTAEMVKIATGRALPPVGSVDRVTGITMTAGIAAMAGRVIELSEEDWDSLPPPQQFWWAGWLPKVDDGGGMVGIAAGPGGVGKTSLVMGLLAYGAHGLPFLGSSTETFESLVINLESGTNAMRRHVAAWRVLEPRLVASVLRAGIRFVPLEGELLRLLSATTRTFEIDERAVDDAADAFRLRAPTARVYVFETLSRISPDETNEAFREVVRALERISRRNGVTALLVHHFTKAAGAAHDGSVGSIRGGGAVVDNCRFALTLVKAPTDNRPEMTKLGIDALVAVPEVADRIVVLRQVKTNGVRAAPVLLQERVMAPHGLVFEVFDLQAQGDAIAAARDAADARQAGTRADAGRKLRAFVAGLVAKGDAVSTNTLKKAARMVGVPERTMSEAVKHALKDGWLAEGPKGKGGAATLVAGPRTVDGLAAPEGAVQLQLDGVVTP